MSDNTKRGSKSTRTETTASSNGPATSTTTTSRPRARIIAEIGANHGKDLNKAIRMIGYAATSGATDVKIQLYTPDQMTLDLRDEDFLIKDGPWSGYYLFDLYKKASTPICWTSRLMEVAWEQGLGFIASVYHPDMVPLAESLGIEEYKVSSFEISYTKLLEALDATNKPVIISTGTATEDEIGAAVSLFSEQRMSLLKCTSQYPAPLDRMNLMTIPDMMRRYQVPVGLSDHSLSVIPPMVAVSLGATIIEKHFKIDEDGFDVGFSLNPAQFREMVVKVREVEETLGSVSYEPSTTRFKRREFRGQWIRTAR